MNVQQTALKALLAFIFLFQFSLAYAENISGVRLNAGHLQKSLAKNIISNKNLQLAQSNFDQKKFNTVIPRTKLPINNGLKRRNLKLPMKQCPDLAITDLAVVRPYKRNNKYNFGVRAIIKNVGNINFDTRNNQVGLYLTQGSRQTHSRRLPYLFRPGQSRRINFSIDGWVAGEFGVPIIVGISYDPDINLDGNKYSGDCNIRNNKMKITVTEINRAIARAR